MNKKHYEESEESEITNLDSLEAYIEASEMYIDALKLLNGKEIDSAYILGMSAVYFGKAFLAFTTSDNTEAMKGSLREAITAYSTAESFCERNNIGKQFIYTSRLIIAGMRTELQNY